MTFEEASLLTASEKITLITVESYQPATVFTYLSELGCYTKNVTSFVSSITADGASLTQVSALEDLENGTFYFDYNNRVVYFILLDAAYFYTKDIGIVYRHFFSNAPVILPHDLNSGYDVEWLPYLNSIGSVGQQLDDENTGIVLESNSTIDLINMDGYFDEIYDTQIWENKVVSFYTWFKEIDVTEARKIFEGNIESKDFSPEKVTFKVKDFVFKLRDKVKLGEFSTSDGTVADSLLGTPKRRVYGQVKQAKLVGIDSVLDGFEMTGTITLTSPSATMSGTATGVYVSNDLSGTLSGSMGSYTITGSGTSFLSQVSPNQKLRVTNGVVTYDFKVVVVNSNTSLTVDEIIEVSFSAYTAKNMEIGSNKVYGIGTSFRSQVQPGDTVRFTNGSQTYDHKVESVETETEITIEDYVVATFLNYTMTNLDVKNNQMIGTGTEFIKELSPGDEISFTFGNTSYSFGIDSVLNDTFALLSESCPAQVIDAAAVIKPGVPYRFKNRKWHIAGHKLREPTATITSVISSNRFGVDDTSDLFENDYVVVNGGFSTIRRVSGDVIVLNNAIIPTPEVDDEIVKVPVQKLYFGAKELVYERDWTYTNTTEAFVTLLPEAEFNITQPKILGASFSFKNGSPVVSTTSTQDLRSILKPRDFIKKNTIVSLEGDWYEILDVKEQLIVLRENFAGTSQTTTAQVKQIEYIEDNSLITADCLGMEVNGGWIKTPAQAVRHLVLNDAGFSSVNESSFTQANADCNYILSVIIPKDVGTASPQIRDVITDINNSVFGSLYGSSTLAISYSILNSDKPEDITKLQDDDILSFNTESKPEIYNNIVVNYRPFVDHNTGNNTFETTSYNSGFVDSRVKIDNKLEKTIYLYEDDKAQIIAQRLALFKSLSTTTVSIKAKMNLFTKSVNDKVLLSLDRLFKRYSSNTKNKIGIVSSVRKAQTEVDITVSDLGNIFNRVPAIAPNTSVDYSAAENDDIIRWGYIVNDYTLTPDQTSEDGLGSNIIG